MVRAGADLSSAPLKLDEPNLEMQLPLHKGAIDYCGCAGGS